MTGKVHRDGNGSPPASCMSSRRSYRRRRGFEPPFEYYDSVELAIKAAGLPDA